MKKAIFLIPVIISFAFANNSFGGTVMGTADMKDNGDGTACLTCPNNGACYRYPLGGHAGEIYIYKNGDSSTEGYGWYEVVGTCQGEYEVDDQPVEWDNRPVIVKEIRN
jgi:hypothetical protein